MGDRKQIENVSDEELIELFNKASSIQEKLQYFSKIKDVQCQIKLLYNIPENEKYKFIGKLRTSESIANALNGLSDEKTKRKTFNFVAKQFKGNSIGLLEILTQIDFDVEIPSNMLTFQLNNINALNLDFLINFQRHLKNYNQMKFKINEDDDSRYIEYSFSEIAAIIAKIEELTADIPKEMDEANKFFVIYSRITGMVTYDNSCIEQEDKARNKFKKNILRNNAFNEYEEEMNKIRKNSAGLYGGLVDGKAICAGYALILHETLKYVGIKSQYVVGYGKKDGHAWNQVQIDGKWYNADPTWDASSSQYYRTYKYMLLNDADFDISHGEFSEKRSKNYRKCTSRFDYSKIKGLSPYQIIDVERTI